MSMPRQNFVRLIGVLQRMEASAENFRFYIYVECKRGVPAKDILQHLRDVFDDAAPSQATVYRWCADFSSGRRISVEHLPIPGHPISARTDTNISKVFDFVEKNPKTSVQCIADSLQLSWTTVQRILTEELLFHKVCSVWVPHQLSEENRKQRVDCCKSLLELYRDYSQYELLRLWATQDESWILFESVPGKSDNKAWLPPQAPRPAVVRPQLTAKKTMLCIVFTGNGKVFAEVTERGEVVDSEWFVDFVHQTGEHWRKLRGDATCLRELLWQHDNARPHQSATTKDFFKKRQIQMVLQSPYSPDLNQCDRWLFKELKRGLRQCQLSNAQDVLQETLTFFRQIPVERFKSELEKLEQHCHHVIAVGGNYVTK
jgi:hypothetical protein